MRGWKLADIKITLETLYDILRNEKKKEDLQKLETTFFLDVVQYLREKQARLESRESSTEIFAAGEKEKIEYELRSIKRIIKEIYEKREKKILDIALNKSRTGSDIIDTSAMLHEERGFYQKILKTLDNFRRGVLQRMHQAELPLVPDQKELKVETAEPEAGPELSRETTPFTRFEPGLKPSLFPALAKIKFTHPMPSFVWKDMKEYGPFDPGEELEIYPEVAELIVKKGRAVRV